MKLAQRNSAPKRFVVPIGSEGDNSKHLACGNFEGLAGTRGPGNAQAGDTLQTISRQLRKGSTVFADNNRAKAVGLKLQGQRIFLRPMIPEVGTLARWHNPSRVGLTKGGGSFGAWANLCQNGTSCTTRIAEKCSR